MREKNRKRVRKILLFISLILLFIGMTAMSFILLHRYAEYGKEASVNMAEPEDEGDGKKRETAPAKTSDKKEKEETTDIFLKKLDPGKTIRVQILGDEYRTEYHETLTVTAKSGIIVSSGKKRQIIPSGEIFHIFHAEKMTDETDENSLEAVCLAGRQRTAADSARTDPGPEKSFL